MCKIASVLIFAFLLVSIAPVHAAQPVSIDGFHIGMSEKDAENTAAKLGLKQFAKAPLDSKSSQIVYDGKLIGFAEARMFLILEGGKVVNVTCETTGEKKAIKAKYDGITKDWTARFGKGGKNEYTEMPEWKADGVVYNLSASTDNTLLTVTFRLE